MSHASNDLFNNAEQPASSQRAGRFSEAQLQVGPKLMGDSAGDINGSCWHQP